MVRPMGACEVREAAEFSITQKVPDWLSGFKVGMRLRAREVVAKSEEPCVSARSAPGVVDHLETGVKLCLQDVEIRNRLRQRRRARDLLRAIGGNQGLAQRSPLAAQRPYTSPRAAERSGER